MGKKVLILKKRGKKKKNLFFPGLGKSTYPGWPETFLFLAVKVLCPRNEENQDIWSPTQDLNISWQR